MSKRPRILFVGYGGGHISMLLPVISEIERRYPHVECLLMALTTGHAKACAVRPTLGYRDFLHLVDADAARGWGERLSIENSSPDVPEDETVAYLGINYLDLIADHGEAGAQVLYYEQGRYGFRPRRFMQRVLEDLQPDAVVSTNSPRSEQAALEAAKSMGIYCVGMVDLFGLDSDTYVRRDIKPDRTCVISEVVRQRLIRRGFAADGVIATGNPAFDGLFRLDTRAQAQNFIDRRGWAGKRVILYIGAWEPVSHPGTDVPAGRSFPIEIEGCLREYVSERKDTVLIVRYHPGDWFKYPQHPAHQSVYFSEPPRDPIHPLILASSVVVNTNSTVGLEAAVAGKPVISLENSPSVHHWFSLADLGVSYPCSSQFLLGTTLDAVLSHGRPLQAFKSDGQAACRVAIVVVEAVTSESVKIQ